MASGPAREASVGRDEGRAAWASDVESHRVIEGRRWRSSDPRIPEELRQQLVDELMAARRAVKAASDDAVERAARDRVHDAKVALGERGLEWWRSEQAPDEVTDRIRRTHRALQRHDATEAEQLMAATAAVVSRPLDEVRAVLDADDVGGPA